MTKFIIMKVHEVIKEIRLQKSLNQKAIADALNVDVTVVSNIENGKRELKVSELAKISKVLKVEVIDLFTYPDKYVKEEKRDDKIKAVLQIELKNSIKKKVLEAVFEKEDIELLK